MASLGCVTPGAATEGVASLFFPEKHGDLFSRQFCGVTPDFFFAKTDDLFCSSLYRFLLLSLRCHSTPFLPVRPRFSTILCKFAHKQFSSFGCHPLEGVTRGGPPPAPSSDATVNKLLLKDINYSHIVMVAFCQLCFK